MWPKDPISNPGYQFALCSIVCYDTPWTIPSAMYYHLSVNIELVSLRLHRPWPWSKIPTVPANALVTFIHTPILDVHKVTANEPFTAGNHLTLRYELTGWSTWPQLASPPTPSHGVTSSINRFLTYLCIHHLHDLLGENCPESMPTFSLSLSRCTVGSGVDDLLRTFWPDRDSKQLLGPLNYHNPHVNLSWRQKSASS